MLKQLVLTFVILSLGATGLSLAMQQEDAHKMEEMQPMKPGPEHEPLKSLIGTWEATVDSSMMGGSVSKGTSVSTFGPGNFWVLTDYQGQYMNLPFKGHGIFGWDKTKNQYFSCWIDSMDSWPMVQWGNYDSKTKTFTVTSTGPDWNNPEQEITYIGKTIVKDENNHRYEMLVKGDDGKEMPVMNITYTRKGGK